MNQSFPTPSWIQHIISGFQLYATTPDGNCFFKSLQIILDSIELPLTIENLRYIVAKPVLEDSNEIVNKTLKTWLELYQGAIKEKDYQLMEEYKHMRGLEDVSIPLTSEQKQHLYRNMMTSIYWAEQHAIRMMEEHFQLRFLIFNEDLKAPQLSWYHSEQFKPTHYCFLYLSNQHYMPVSFRDKFIYVWKNLPYEVQLFFTRAYKPIVH
jgi:hypothetical protein